MIDIEKTSPAPSDKFGRAGYDAELQMAFYLRRAFGDSPDVFVFNDVRFERNNEFAQIDHLVLHRFGWVIVESKSVVSTVSVNDNGEFTRTFDGYERGMPSPIRQAKLQAELLSKLLNDHKDRLRRKVFMGLIQGEFGVERFRCLVAISDRGIIKRRNCNPPELFKAEQIVEQIRETISRHARATSFSGLIGSLVADRKTAQQLEADNLPAYTNEELTAMRQFVMERNVPLTSKSCEPVVVIPTKPAVMNIAPKVMDIAPVDAVVIGLSCRGCQSSDVLAVHGRYGYYAKCNKCGGNTPIDAKCTNCSGKARIQKSKLNFTRICEACGTQTLVHVNAMEPDTR